MSSSVQQYILEKIAQRKAINNFRTLKSLNGLVDFFSNDYLGFSSNGVIAKRAAEIEASMKIKNGSTGSRLLSGNSEFAEALEAELAAFHDSETALLFNSGYDANLGVLSSIPHKNATIIFDELVHASMHDGMRLSKAQKFSFRHNDLNDLENNLQKIDGLKFIAIEALYSMDGDEAPLAEIVAFAKKYDAAIVLDEAHSNGVIGSRGEGKAQSENLHSDVFIRIHTFGKAIGAHGAVALCSKNTRDFLINFCRPFIFSTALPFHSLAVVKAAYEYLPDATAERAKLHENIRFFRGQLNDFASAHLLPGTAPVQCIIVNGNDAAKALAEKIQQRGFDVRPILSPTVPVGKERIRICIHSFNTKNEIEGLAKAINDAMA